MNTTIKNGLSAVERWIDWLGIPALLIAIMIAGAVVVVHEAISQ